KQFNTTFIGNFSSKRGGWEVNNQHVLKGRILSNVEDIEGLTTQWSNEHIREELKRNLHTALQSATASSKQLDADGNRVAISTTLTLKYWERVLSEIEVIMESDFLTRIFIAYTEPLQLILQIGLNNGLIPTDESLEKIYVFGVVPSLTPEGKCIFKGSVDPHQFPSWNFVRALDYSGEIEVFLDASIHQYYPGEHLAPKHALVVAQTPEPNHKWLKMVLSKRSEAQQLPRSETSPYFKEWRERVSQMDLSSGGAAALIEFVDYGTLEEPNKSPTIAMELFTTGSKFQFPELELEVKNLLLRKPTSWFDAASLQVYCQGVNLDASGFTVETSTSYHHVNE
ncbi:hypothetical protein Ocin01_06980, partial [Orchesella cincta]